MELFSEFKVSEELMEKEVNDLAIKAIDVSDTYQEASKKVLELLSKVQGPTAEFLITATQRKINQIAMQKKTAD